MGLGVAWIAGPPGRGEGTVTRPAATATVRREAIYTVLGPDVDVLFYMTIVTAPSVLCVWVLLVWSDVLVCVFCE